MILSRTSNKKHKLPEIIAPVHPGNERSIRVLQKAGMTYKEDVCHKGHMIPCYVIINNLLGL